MSPLFANLTDYGWVRLEAHGVKHWSEKNRLLCGLKPGPELREVLGQDAMSWNEHVGACKKCVSELVRRGFDLPFRVGQRVISRACGMVLRGKIVRFFLFNDNTPALDITREWARPPEEITIRGHDVFENDIYPHDWYRAAHECKPLEEKPMTQTTTKKASAAKNLPVKAKQDSGKKVKIPAVTPASADTSTQGLVESATCPETGSTYSVGDWVSYSIKGVDMTGQILLVLTQAPPYQTVAEVPNHTTGRPWTLELRELQRAQAPDADSPFPVTEADIDVAITSTPTPELTPVDVVAVPVITLAEPLTPGTLGMHAIPLAQLVRSGCNVRRHYDPDTIQEMAASLKAEGQIENATGRWNAQGQVEIVAGESRRRAQMLREEAGELGLTLLVNVRILDDAEALAISATENMRRKNMTGLEECEAMMRLNDAGRTVEDVAAMFGFETLKPVADRVLVARNLHTKGRDALDSGEMSLACAFVIARAAGVDVQNSMVQQATSSHNRATATQLAAQLTKGQVLVRHAKFNVEKSGLAIKRDLFDVFEAFFEDKAAALNAQIAWAQGRAEKLREAGKHAFVHVVTDLHFYRYNAPYDGTESSKGKGGFVFVISPSDGAVTEEHDVRLKPNKQVTAAPDGSSKIESAGAVREMPDSAYLEAHMLRAQAARASVVGDPHLTLALTVWGLILGNNSDVGRISVGQLSGIGAKELIPPELQARQNALQQMLTASPGVSRGSDHVYMAAFNHSGAQADPHKLLVLLVGMTDEELLGHLNTLTALVAYNWSAYSNKNAPAAEYVYLAGLTGAPARLAQDFILTDEWLRRYPRHELVALAEEAGLGRALVEDAKTQKEMRARILEHAAKLHAEGFVPRLVRFPKAVQA